MVKLYTDEEMDEKCKDFRPVPLKLYGVVYGLESRATNPLTNIKSDRMLSVPAANINLATKSNIRLNTIPASVIEKRYNSLYQDVIVGGKNINTEIDIEMPIPTPAPAVNPEDERPPPNKEPELTGGSEAVISTYVDPSTGEVEELMQPERDIPKPDAKKGLRGSYERSQ